MYHSQNQYVYDGKNYYNTCPGTQKPRCTLKKKLTSPGDHINHVDVRHGENTERRHNKSIAKSSCNTSETIKTT